MRQQAIRIEQLRVRAGRRTLLDLEHLAVQSGEMLGLLGPNGAGKTTFLRACLGFQRHVAGAVHVLGEPVHALGLGRIARLRLRVGYVPQLLPVRSEMPVTVREVVAIGRTGTTGLLRRLTRSDWSIVDEWIERLGLAGLARRGYGEVSGGEQRKTLIARAMAQQPELLLLDEPTANLDLGWRERIVQLVSDLYRSLGISVVLVCHELEVLPTCCRRVLVLDAGRAVADGPPDAVLTDRLLDRMYGPGLSVLRRGDRYAVVPEAITHA